MRIRRGGGFLELTSPTSARERLAEKLAEREAKKAEGARMLAEAVFPDDEIDAFDIAATVEAAVELAQAEHRANAAALVHDAHEAESQAADLRARAGELEVDSELLERLAAQRFEAEAAAAGLQHALEQSILAAKTEAELRLIEEARDERRREARELEARCEQLRERVAESAQLRAEAAGLLEQAAELRRQAEQLVEAAELVPALAPRFVAAERDRRKRLRERSQRVPVPGPAGSDGMVLIKEPPGITILPG